MICHRFSAPRNFPIGCASGKWEKDRNAVERERKQTLAGLSNPKITEAGSSCGVCG